MDGLMEWIDGCTVCGVCCVLCIGKTCNVLIV
jgi:hypothetical protein